MGVRKGSAGKGKPLYTRVHKPAKGGPYDRNATGKETVELIQEAIIEETTELEELAKRLDIIVIHEKTKEGGKDLELLSYHDDAVVIIGRQYGSEKMVKYFLDVNKIDTYSARISNLDSKIAARISEILRTPLVRAEGVEGKIQVGGGFPVRDFSELSGLIEAHYRMVYS